MGELDLAPLVAAVTGTVTGREDPGYDGARMPWNMRDQRPAAVVEVATPADVAAALTFAADADLRVAAQPTGHGASWDYEGTLLLRTGRLRDVVIDSESRSARFGAGVLWNEVLDPAAEVGLTALAGTAPHVGATGYTLGGGLGWLARRDGLCANRLRAADVVLADGTITRIDEQNDPDLLWALRGGGGNYAIVTSMEMELISQAKVYAGNLVFPLERASEVIPAWREWVGGLPNDATSTIVLIRVPDMPAVPEHLRGQELAIVSTCVAIESGSHDELFAQMRGLAPIADTLSLRRPNELADLHNDPVDPIPATGGAAILRELDDATIGRLLEQVGPGSGTPLLMAEVRHCGGAIRTPAVPGGVRDRFDGEFVAYVVGVPAGPRAGEIAPAIEGLVEALAPASTGEMILNFEDDPSRAKDAFPPEDLARLREIKRARDPHGRIVSNHPLG
jgi:FAD/FMN-containing dehydrogenase